MKMKRIIAGIISAALVCITGIQTAAEEPELSAQAEKYEAEAGSKLKNKTVKYLSHYDLGSSDSAKLFKKKYGGELKWFPTTWAYRYNDLSTFVLGGEGIDFFPCYNDTLPEYAADGCFQSIDKYVNVDKSSFKTFKKAMETYNFNGSHYCLVTDVTAANVVFYNKKTIEEHDLDDPYKQWKSGEWNWDTFKDTLAEYVDPSNYNYGLDGWWFESAFYTSAGKPVVGNSKGKLVSNYSSKTIDKAMKYAANLYDNGLVFDSEAFDWYEQPQFLGEGKELFYIAGPWIIQDDPESWVIKTDPKDLGMVPVPSPKGSKNYMEVNVEGYCLCKGADNPAGAVRFAECDLTVNNSESYINAENKLFKKKYKWTDELVKNYRNINKTARKYPVIELAYGTSNDIACLSVEGGKQVGVKGPFNGLDWEDEKKEIAPVFEMLIDEENEEIKKMQD